MKNKLLFLILIFSMPLLANQFGSSSLQFEERIQKKCGIVFYNQSGIYFKNEEVQALTRFYLYSNDKKVKKVTLNFSNIRKSDNFTNISNSRFSLTINENKTYNADEIISRKIKLAPGVHTIYIKVDEDRNRVLSGIANIRFNIEASCKN